MRRKDLKNRPTIKDIAREAHISAATVSLVLRDPDTPRVGDATRKRVIRIAKRLRYRPNLMARSLAGNRSSTLGLVITTLLNPFYAEMTQAIIDRAREDDYGVIASSVGGQGLTVERHYVNELLDRGVDGLIICSALRKDPVIDELRSRGVPFVLALRGVDVSPGEPAVDFVGVDDKRGALMATEHLIALGHTRIALIAGPQETATGYYRLAGAKEGFKSQGVELDPSLIFQGDYSRESGYAIVQEILRTTVRPTAIFSGNDIMAVGVMDALAEKGLKAPEDMALVGFDDIEMAGLPGIDLTTVSHQKITLGRLAVEQLLDKINGRSEQIAKRFLIDPVLVVRKTCGFRKTAASAGN